MSKKKLDFAVGGAIQYVFINDKVHATFINNVRHL